MGYEGLVTPLLKKYIPSEPVTFKDVLSMTSSVLPFQTRPVFNAFKPILQDVFNSLHPELVEVKQSQPRPRGNWSAFDWRYDPSTRSQNQKTFTFTRYKYFKGGVTLWW